MRRAIYYFDIVFYLAVYAYCLREHRPGWQYIVGMALATAGYALWFVARAQLGRSFTPKPEAHALVTTGLYSKIRNPIYAFSILGIAGICFAMHWYIFGAVYIPLLALVQWRRAKAEGVVLQAAFGDSYRQYRAQTWF